MSRAGVPLKSECIRGHPRTPETVGRHCPDCERERGRRRYQDPSRRSYCIAYRRRYDRERMGGELPCCGHTAIRHDPEDSMRCYHPGCECEGPR